MFVLRFGVRFAVRCSFCGSVFVLRFGVCFAVRCSFCGSVFVLRFGVRFAIRCSFCDSVFVLRFGVAVAVGFFIMLLFGSNVVDVMLTNILSLHRPKHKAPRRRHGRVMRLDAASTSGGTSQE